MPTIVAVVRTLLMQPLHPGALAGVHDPSRFRGDPWAGRLMGVARPPLSEAEIRLAPRYRELLGLRTARLGPIPLLPLRLATKAALAVVHLALGRVGSSEQDARSRLGRLG